MAIAIERSGVTTRRIRRYRARRWIGHALVYLGLAASLVFFLGPFFWIVTTSLKGNEDFFAFPPVWIPADASLTQAEADTLLVAGTESGTLSRCPSKKFRRWYFQRSCAMSICSSGWQASATTLTGWTAAGRSATVITGIVFPQLNFLFFLRSLSSPAGRVEGFLKMYPSSLIFSRMPWKWKQ